MAALDGIRVYDLTQGIAGPHATMLLALHGATVVKVEPLTGDWCRALGTSYGEQTASSFAFNRRKRSIALDLRSVAGREISRRLAQSSDVFVESFRPGVAARLGLSYEDLRAINANVVYGSMSGFGQSGPFSKRGTVDAMVQAFSGMMVMNRSHDGVPQRSGMTVVDIVSGLYLFQALSMAAVTKMRFGQGSYIDCSLMQSAAAMQASKIIEWTLTEGKSRPLYMPSGMVRTADGAIVVSTMSEESWKKLCIAIDRSDLTGDKRFVTAEARIDNGSALMMELASTLSTKSSRAWLEKLVAHDVLAEVVQDYGQWLQSEQVLATNAFQTVVAKDLGQVAVANIPGVDCSNMDDTVLQAPGVGEHTLEILHELGYDAHEISVFLDCGAVRSGSEKRGG